MWARYRVAMAETLMFMALGLGIVLVVGFGIIGSRPQGRRTRESDGFDPGMSHMWIDHSSSDSSGSDCSPGATGSDSGGGCGGGGGDGGGGGGGSD